MIPTTTAAPISLEFILTPNDNHQPRASSRVGCMVLLERDHSKDVQRAIPPTTRCPAEKDHENASASELPSTNSKERLRVSATCCSAPLRTSTPGLSTPFEQQPDQAPCNQATDK